MSTVTESTLSRAEALAAAARGPHLELLWSIVEADDTAKAVREVFRQESPRQHQADEQLSNIFDEPYNEMTCSFMEAALIVGIQIGRTLSAGGGQLLVHDEPATDEPPSATTVDGDLLPHSLGGRLGRVRQLLVLVEASAGAINGGKSSSWGDEYAPAIQDAASEALGQLYWCVENVPHAVLATPALDDDELAERAR